MSDHSPARTAAAVRGARRTSSVAVALAVLVTFGLAGCGTPGPGTPPGGGEPSGTPGASTSGSPAQAPESPDPGNGSPTTPGRSVTAANLLTTDVVYLDPSYQTAVETPEGVGRPTNQSYVCLPDDGLASLGATAMVTRNFGYEVTDPELDPYPKSPLKNQPIIYTQALQFPDAAAATKARALYAGWIQACPATLTEKGYSIDTGQSLKLTKLQAEGGTAQAGMVAYVKPGESDAVRLWWESAGVTQVKDRLMITVNLSWGEDTPGTFDDSDGDFIHPQLILVEESALKLAE
ncbi:MAG TPA: hypothetical protein VFR88_03130 [Microlunatus sp.]|nr:hypothetical protein [Microlunatus sp.]